MNTGLDNLSEAVARIEQKLTELDAKLDTLAQNRRKSMEWMATLASHVESLDAFREEVRSSLEPLFQKLQHLDEIIRIHQHATSDVARRIETLEEYRRCAG